MKRNLVLILILILFSTWVYADSTYVGPGGSPTSAFASMDLELDSTVISTPIVLYGFYSGETSATTGVVKDGTLILEEKLKSATGSSLTFYGAGSFTLYIYFLSDGKVTVKGTLSHDAKLTSGNLGNTKELNLTIDGGVSSTGTEVYNGKEVFKHATLNYTATTATYTDTAARTYTGNIYFTLTVTS